MAVHQWYNNVNNQLDVTITVLLIISISSTCFGRQFRPSSGALDCVYSLWYNAPTMLPAGSIVGALYHIIGTIAVIGPYNWDRHGGRRNNYYILESPYYVWSIHWGITVEHLAWSLLCTESWGWINNYFLGGKTPEFLSKDSSTSHTSGLLRTAIQSMPRNFNISLIMSRKWGTAVAQWLRCCVRNQKVAGSIQAGVIGIFHWHKIPPIALWPWGRLSL